MNIKTTVKRIDGKTNESKQIPVWAAGECLFKPSTPSFFACKYGTQNSVFPGILVYRLAL